MSLIHNFGNEDKTFLTSYDFRNIIISHYRGITRLINLIYFNPNKPANHTLKYNVTDTKYVLVYESGSYQAIIKEYVLDTIIIDAWALLVNYFNMIEINDKRNAFKNTLASEETLERIDAFIADYKKLCNGYTPAMLHDIRNDVYELIKFHYMETEKKKKKPKKT